MELFDSHFVWFGQVLAVSRMKLLVTSNQYVATSGKITTIPRLFLKHSLQEENKRQIMNVHTKWNCLIPILSSLDNFTFVSVSAIAWEGGANNYWAWLTAHSRVRRVRHFNFSHVWESRFQCVVLWACVLCYNSSQKCCQERGGTWTWWKIRFPNSVPQWSE